jgi:hypothetical protein
MGIIVKFITLWTSKSGRLQLFSLKNCLHKNDFFLELFVEFFSKCLITLWIEIENLLILILFEYWYFKPIFNYIRCALKLDFDSPRMKQHQTIEKNVHITYIHVTWIWFGQVQLIRLFLIFQLAHQ